MLRGTTWWVALLLMAACSGRDSPSVGGESHWLSACRQDSDCGNDNLSCVCGTCTRACSTDASCQGGQCYDTDSPLLLQRCEAHELQGAGVCLATCKLDTDCGRERACVEGACIAKDEFAGVDAAVSWSEPVQELPSSPVIAGDVSAKVGTWRDLDCDPTLPSTVAGCVTLTLKRSASGEVQGELRFDRPDQTSSPFAPVVDPNRGYPVEASVAEYANLTLNGLTGLPYRVENGQLRGDELSFEWNSNELWRDWCGMQTPHAWQVGPRTRYFCVPQDQRQWEGMDLGKVVLCRDADAMELCTDRSDVRIPCVCLDPTDPLCNFSRCRCNAQTCGLPPNQERATAKFESDQRTAFLTLDEDSFLKSIHRLTKVEP